MGYAATFPKLKSYYRSSPGTVFRYHFPGEKCFAKSMAMVFRWSDRQGARFIKMKSSPILSHDFEHR